MAWRGVDAVARARWLALPLLWGLAACGGGGSDGSAGATGAVSTLACGPDASAATALGRLHNNTWNAALVGSQPWQQCLRQRGSGDSAQFGWSWQWPDTFDEVLAYPSLVVGAKPWEDGPGNDARFPRRIADLRRLHLDAAFETTASGRYNMAASMWLIDQPRVSSPADEGAIRAEVMVWAESRGTDWTAGSTPLAEVSIDGQRWRVWAQPRSSGGTTWPLVSYTAVQPSSSLVVDLAAVLADAVARGLVDATWYVADVELGNEIAGGAGSTWIRRFVLTVQ